MRNVMYSVEPFRTKEVHSQVTFQKKKKKNFPFELGDAYNMKLSVVILLPL